MPTELDQVGVLHGLRELGVRSGDTIMVHSSLSSLGRVRGGENAVCDALIAACGPTGTVMMSTSGPRSTSLGGDQPFDVAATPSEMGSISEAFRRRADTVRSRHPTHAVAAWGAHAARLIDRHEVAKTAYGPDTPYERLLDVQGRILLLGCDQDRNTFLHTVEAAAGVPYLQDITAEHFDEDGHIVCSTVRQMAGPHRAFIGVDRMLRQAGIVRVGRIGNAVCRLMDASDLFGFLVPRLRQDPGMFLCRNPSCESCGHQGGKVREQELAAESFSLTASTAGITAPLRDVVRCLRRHGIKRLELSAMDGQDVVDLRDQDRERLGRELAPLEGSSFHPPMDAIKVVSIRSERRPDDVDSLVAAARRLGVSAITVPATRDAVSRLPGVPTGVGVILENGVHGLQECLDIIGRAAVQPAFAGLAFDPTGFVRHGVRPFLDVLRGNVSRLHLRQLVMCDCSRTGTALPLAQGLAEVKELLSILRCRSFGGDVVLRGPEAAGFSIDRQACDFHDLLHSL